jgi:hypothetical protein
MYSADTLDGAIRSYIRVRPEAADVYPTHFDNITPFRRLMSIIAFLPFKWRKLLLTACRIQQPIMKNTALTKAFFEIDNHKAHIRYQVPQRKSRSRRGKNLTRVVYDTREISLYEICDLFEHVYHNPLLCTALSYFCRAEGTHLPEEFIEARTNAIYKEIRAS